jgi:hypothetical protein
MWLCPMCQSHYTLDSGCRPLRNFKGFLLKAGSLGRIIHVWPLKICPITTVLQGRRNTAMTIKWQLSKQNTNTAAGTTHRPCTWRCIQNPKNSVFWILLTKLNVWNAPTRYKIQLNNELRQSSQLSSDLGSREGFLCTLPEKKKKDNKPDLKSLKSMVSQVTCEN